MLVSLRVDIQIARYVIAENEWASDDHQSEWVVDRNFWHGLLATRQAMQVGKNVRTFRMYFQTQKKNVSIYDIVIDKDKAISLTIDIRRYFTTDPKHQIIN